MLYLSCSAVMARRAVYAAKIIPAIAWPFHVSDGNARHKAGHDEL